MQHLHGSWKILRTALCNIYMGLEEDLRNALCNIYMGLEEIMRTALVTSTWVLRKS